jgi:hypothetical protein
MQRRAPLAPVPHKHPEVGAWAQLGKGGRGARVPLRVQQQLLRGGGCVRAHAARAGLGRAGPTAADGLGNLRDLFRLAASGKAALPKSLAEFTSQEPFYPVAGPFVLSGEIGCAWGAGLKQGPEAAKRVLAFETRAAQDGGWVMFQDGTIREVTAEEFAAAPKATP